MQLHLIPAEDIVIRTNRQRREFPQDKILELAGSIAENGLLHPIVVYKADGEYTLIAGERRLKALEHLWFLGQEITCNNYIIEENYVPCVYLGELDPIAAEECELEENIRREDLTWQERADATSRLAALRAAQAQRDGKEPPSVAEIAEEAAGSAEGQFQENTRQDIILGHALADPAKREVIKNATSRKDAFKLLKRHEDAERSAQFAATVGKTFNRSMHTLLQGDCLSLMPTLPAATFDVILTDPPYGIGADGFGDSGGKAAGGHFYDDSEESWRKLVRALPEHFTRLAKPSAHLYLFCDVTRFLELSALFKIGGWKVFRTPLIWHKPDGMRAPWPEQGPWRRYETILYAVRGDRPCTHLYSDLVSYPSDPNLGHPAQKPVALLTDLLRRSIIAGDSILDPFCGSGAVFAAAHALKGKATGMEMDPGAAGIAAKRLEALK